MSSIDSYLAKKDAEKHTEEVLKQRKNAILQMLSKEYYIHVPEAEKNESEKVVHVIQCGKNASSESTLHVTSALGKRTVSPLCQINEFPENRNS